MRDIILFDLDGTLTNPKVGITTSVQYALSSFGIEEDTDSESKKFSYWDVISICTLLVSMWQQRG